MGVDPDTFVHCDSVCGLLDVTQNTVSKHLQVWMFKYVPVGPVKAVLQLLSFYSLSGGSFPEGSICRDQKQRHMVSLAQVLSWSCSIVFVGDRLVVWHS